MHKSKLVRLLALFLTIGVVAAACGSDGDDSADHHGGSSHDGGSGSHDGGSHDGSSSHDDRTGRGRAGRKPSRHRPGTRNAALWRER